MLSSPSSAVSTIDYFVVGLKGYGQVIFQDNAVSGLLFFIAVLLSLPTSALYGLAGAILSAIIASKMAFSNTDIAAGLFSYNGVLCAVLFAGTKVTDGIWVLFSVLLALLVFIVMATYNFLPLTFPFVLASCITLFFKSKFHFIIKKQRLQQRLD